MNFVSHRSAPGSLVYYKSRDCSIQFLQQRTFNLHLIFSFYLSVSALSKIDSICVCEAISICLTSTSAGSAVGRGMVKVDEREDGQREY